MTNSEINQLKEALNMFVRDPKAFHAKYEMGRLRLCADAMYVLYLHYMSKISFVDIYKNNGFACTLNEDQKYIAKRFIDVLLEK